LHHHNFPRQRHPQGRAPDHWPAADRIIECARVTDQPRVSGKLRESYHNSEEKKSREQCVTPNNCKPDQQTIIDKIKSRARTPIRPRRKRQQRNRDDVDENRRNNDKQALAFSPELCTFVCDIFPLKRVKR